MPKLFTMTRDAGAGESPDLLRVTSPVGRMVRAVETEKDSGYRDYEVELSTDFRRGLWGGTYETLVHTNAALMRDFVDRGMSYFQARSHYSGDLPGKILEKSLRFEQAGDLTKLVGTVRIVDDGAAGTAQIKRWDAGVNRNLSIDYEWREWVIAESKDDDETDIRVEKWRLRGVSAVSDPADEEVGVMDAATRKSLEDCIMTRKRKVGSQIMQRDDASDEEVKKREADAEAKKRDEEAAAAKARDAEEEPAAAKADAKARADDPDANPFDADMAEIGREYDETMTAVSERKLTNASMAKLLELRGDAKGRIRGGSRHVAGSLTQEMFKHLAIANEGGVTVSEEFSSLADGTVQRDGSKSKFGRAAADGYANLAQSSPGVDFAEGALDFARGRNTTRNAGAAMELHDALVGGMESSVQANFQGGGIMIPPDMYCRMLASALPAGHPKREKLEKMSRTFLALTGNKGPNLIQTDVLIEEFVDALHASAHLEMLGARQLMGLSSNIQIPRQSAKLEPTWITEVADSALIDSNIGAVTSVPHRISGTTDVSLLLQIQTGGAADDLVMRMLQMGMEENIDVSVLAGASAGDDPTGVINISGITSTDVPLATAGDAARYANMLAVSTALLEADVPQMGIKWSVAAEAVSLLQATPRVVRRRRLVLRHGGQHAC